MSKNRPSITHSFEIDTDRWLHGNKNQPLDDSALRLPNGKMCCLGFFAESCGIKKKDMTKVGHPMTIEHLSPKLRSYLVAPGNKDYANEYERPEIQHLIDANDEGEFTIDQRKKRITQLFHKIGVAVKFYSGKKRKAA